MLGTLTGWLGLSTSKKETIKSEINVMDAIDAHVRWKVRLQDYLNGASQETLDPHVICRDDRCALGAWIHGPAREHFDGHSEFHVLKADHAQFHLIAADVVARVQANDRAAADSLMQNDYARVSHKVVHSLTQLHKHLGD